jgi:hypothetical protein
MYVIVPSAGNEFFTVGFYEPTGRWVPIQDCSTREQAKEVIHYLNGGMSRDQVAELVTEIEELRGVILRKDFYNPSR